MYLFEYNTHNKEKEMLVTQIRSILRNKVNRIYIILSSIFFIVLNLGINFQTVLDIYCNIKVYKAFIFEIIKYIVILIISIMYFLSYRKIIKNELINMKILRSNGYSNKQIQKIMFFSLSLITIMGDIIAFGVLSFILYIKNLSIFDYVNIRIFSINLLTVMIPLSVNIITKLKKVN